VRFLRASNLTDVKLVTAYLRSNKLEEAKAALEDVGIAGLSMETVRGYGRQMGRTDKYRGSTYAVNLLPKIKLEIVLKDEDLELAIEALSAVARSGEIGDGKIFVSEVLEAVRIRTGERGEAAIS